MQEEDQQNPSRCRERDHLEWVMAEEVVSPSDENFWLSDKSGIAAHSHTHPSSCEANKNASLASPKYYWCRNDPQQVSHVHHAKLLIWKLKWYRDDSCRVAIHPTICWSGLPTNVRLYWVPKSGESWYSSFMLSKATPWTSKIVVDWTVYTVLDFWLRASATTGLWFRETYSIMPLMNCSNT